MADRPVWTLKLGDADEPLLLGGKLADAVREAASGDWGFITAQRLSSTEKLSLRFDESFGLLEHWQDENGPISGARFPNRSPVSETQVELPCCGCGVAFAVPDAFVLPKADAIRLFLQFLDSGELPGELVEPPLAADQLVLPEMEEFVVPPAVRNAVRWDPL